MEQQVRTFSGHSMVTFDRTDINMEGIRYTTTENYWCKIIEEDMPKLKALLGDRLYEYALDGGNTIEIPEDEVWSESQALYERAKNLAYDLQVATDEILNPLLVEHGYIDSKGVAIKTHVINLGINEDTSKVPTEDDL